MAMSKDVNKLLQNLQKFGMSEEEATVYMYLVERGLVSVLTMSRELKLSRPKLYRILERLMGLKLVEKEAGGGSRYKATAYAYLDMLITEREREIQKVKELKPEVFEALTGLSASKFSVEEMREYSGQEAYVEMIKNASKARGVLVWESPEMLLHRTKEAAEAVVNSWKDSRAKVRVLSNQKTVDTEAMPESFVKKHWESKWVDPKKMLIVNEVLVYGDVVALAGTEGGQIYCVEYKSRLLADMQRQMFGLAWSVGESGD